MLSAPLPPNETARLLALRRQNVLDTPPEERFDRFTRIARRIFGVPIALVSLVDESRQWFKSRQGLDVTETPRDISFCGHAILQDEVLLVPDARLDPRFADNPLVTGDPNIRFYAGCPIRSDDGSPLGTVCLIDRQPRELDPDDLTLLRDLAAAVEQEFLSIRTATTDDLTKISNRRGFHALAAHALALCGRLRAALTLLYFDLDGFKQINDRLGHATGDRALIDFAEALVATFRNADAIARLGGDEFCVLAVGSPEVMDSPLARLGARLRSLQGRPYQIAYSVGRVGYDPAQHRSLEDLLAAADRLMYERKREQKPPPPAQG